MTISNPTAACEDEYLTGEQVQHLSTLLRQQASDLLDAGREAVNALTTVRSQDADSLDVAVNESNREFNLRLADRERRLLGKIRYALRRLDEGEYGACEGCGEPITYKRLIARPVATMCIDCKTEAEQLNRSRRAF